MKKMTKAEIARCENERKAFEFLTNWRRTKEGYGEFQRGDLLRCLDKAIEALFEFVRTGKPPKLDASWGDTEIIVYTMLRDSLQQFVEEPKDIQEVLARRY